MFYTSQGRMRLTDSRYKNDMYPVDTSCDCYTCKILRERMCITCSRLAILSATLATIHNLTWFAKFMATCVKVLSRDGLKSIENGYMKFIHRLQEHLTILSQKLFHHLQTRIHNDQGTKKTPQVPSKTFLQQA